MKTKKLTCEYDFRRPDPYKVVRVEHTTEFNPGEFLSKKKLDELNASNRWHVVVIGMKG